MHPKVRLAMIFVALALLGCKSPAESSAAGTGAAATASGARTEDVPDTTLNNMTAFSVTMPSNWKFQGVLLQGGVALCDSLASRVWRATSPDGSSFVEEEPQLLWAWGNGPKPVQGCLPQNGPLSAQDLLAHVAGMLHVTYVGPDQMPEAMARAVKQYQDATAHPDHFTRRITCLHPRSEPRARQPWCDLSGARQTCKAASPHSFSVSRLPIQASSRSTRHTPEDRSRWVPFLPLL